MVSYTAYAWGSQVSRNGIFGLWFISNIEDCRENITTDGAKFLEFNRVLNMEFETSYCIEVRQPPRPFN